MYSNGNSTSLVEICSDCLDEAVEVLALAFENDPFIRYLCSEPAYLRKVAELFRFVCEARLELGQPLIGIARNNELIGVACISAPGKKDWPSSLVNKQDRMRSIIGEEAFARIRRFSNLSKKYAPTQSHYYLAALGIHPDFQKQGLGRLLLDTVSEMSASHPESTGVYLETANQSNVAFYEHFGYRLAAKDTLDNTVDLWFMFRRDQP